MMWVARTMFFRMLLIFIMITALSGCASGWVVKVTSYQQWPANAVGATYTIKQARQPDSALKFAAVSEQLHQAIHVTGLTPAPEPNVARFDVVVDYGQRLHRVFEQHDVDPYWGGWRFSPYFGGFYGSHWGWHSGVVMSPVTVAVPVDYVRHTLAVTIRDRAASGAEVYQASAVITSGDESFIQVLPYLTEAVFDGFPGLNGQVREIRFQPQR